MLEVLQTAAGRSNPHAPFAILVDGADRPVRQSLGRAVAAGRGSIFDVTHPSSPRSDPYPTGARWGHRENGGVRQALLATVDLLFSVGQTHQGVVKPEPQRSSRVLSDAEHSAFVKTLRYAVHAKGGVAQLRNPFHRADPQVVLAILVERADERGGEAGGRHGIARSIGCEPLQARVGSEPHRVGRVFEDCRHVAVGDVAQSGLVDEYAVAEAEGAATRSDPERAVGILAQ